MAHKVLTVEDLTLLETQRRFLLARIGRPHAGHITKKTSATPARAGPAVSALAKDMHETFEKHGSKARQNSRDLDDRPTQDECVELKRLLDIIDRVKRSDKKSDERPKLRDRTAENEEDCAVHPN